MNQLGVQDDQGSAGNEQVCPPIAAESSVSAEVKRTSGGGDVAAPERKGWRKGKRWPWLAGIVLLAVALLAAGGWFAAGAVARACCSRADAYYAEGSLDQALAEYERAIRLRPSYAEAYLGRGKAYHEKGDLERAIADYIQAIAKLDQAITLNPQDAEAYSLRGDAYLAKGDLDRAIADYDRAIGLRPDDAKAHENRGLAYAQKRAVSEAISSLHNYGLDQLLTDQDDPCLWAAAIRKHGLPDCFGIGIEDKADEQIGMVNLESPCFGWADGKPLRAVSPDPKQSCFNNCSCLYISRPSAGLRHALVYKADFFEATAGGSMGGQTMLWIRQLDGSWHETKTSVAVWGIVWDW